MTALIAIWIFLGGVIVGGIIEARRSQYVFKKYGKWVP